MACSAAARRLCWRIDERTGTGTDSDIVVLVAESMATEESDSLSSVDVKHSCCSTILELLSMLPSIYNTANMKGMTVIHYFSTIYILYIYQGFPLGLLIR